MKLQRTKRGTKAGIGKRLAEDKRRLAEWRKRKRPGERIPERFWEAALSYQGELPLYRISREFSLDYNRLKKQTSGLPACQAETGLELTGRFVEAPWLGIPVGPDGMGGGHGEGQPNLVLERPDGNRLRVEGQLPELRYVQGLVAVFCRAEGC